MVLHSNTANRMVVTVSVWSLTCHASGAKCLCLGCNTMLHLDDLSSRLWTIRLVAFSLRQHLLECLNVWSITSPSVRDHVQMLVLTEVKAILTIVGARSQAVWIALLSNEECCFFWHRHTTSYTASCIHKSRKCGRLVKWTVALDQLAWTMDDIPDTGGTPGLGSAVD
eukprot:scpid80699/ scgid32872/ 